MCDGERGEIEAGRTVDLVDGNGLGVEGEDENVLEPRLVGDIVHSVLQHLQGHLAHKKMPTPLRPP